MTVNEWRQHCVNSMVGSRLRRHESARARRVSRLRWVLFWPAAIGFAALAWQITAADPRPPVAVAAMALTIPWLSTWTVRL